MHTGFEALEPRKAAHALQPGTCNLKPLHKEKKLLIALGVAKGRKVSVTFAANFHDNNGVFDSC